MLSAQVINVIHVRPDGNCGFRVVAHFVHGDAERWTAVRQHLLAELLGQRRLQYEILLGAHGHAQATAVAKWDNGPCPPEKWMVMPDFGYAIANAYSRLVLIFSQELCLTFLPFGGPLTNTDPISMVLAASHYDGVALPNDCALPPLVPGWTAHATPAALTYAENLAARFEAYLQGTTECEETETIDLTAGHVEQKMQ